MAVFFSALLLALAALFSMRYSFEPFYIPPVRGEGLLQGIKVGEEKGVWMLETHRTNCSSNPHSSKTVCPSR